MFYLTMHSTHFSYGYMASDIWLRTILIVRKETRCRHISYSYRLTARVLLYAQSHRQDNTAFVTPVVEHWLEREKSGVSTSYLKVGMKEVNNLQHNPRPVERVQCTQVVFAGKRHVLKTHLHNHVEIVRGSLA